MIISADQLTLHLIGDYVTQSDWMANNKTKASFPACCHALVYSVPFLLFQPSMLGFLTILVTHFFIDRFRLARYVVWAKNFLAPGGFNPSWASVKDSFGYPANRPVWMTCWLMIIADNIIHICINGLALRYL